MRSLIVFRFGRHDGFTAIEAFAVIAILSVLLLMGLGGYQASQRRSNITSNAHEIVSYLERARVLSTVNYSDVRYGVHFEADRYVLFPGPTYVGGDPENEEQKMSGFNFTNPVIFSDGVGGMTQDVLFQGLSGQTNNTGTIRLESNSEETLFRLLTINELGTVIVQ